MSAGFRLSFDLAGKIEGAMIRDGGWSAELVDRLCEADNLLEVQRFLLSGEAPTHSGRTIDVVAIKPKRTLRIPHKPNRKFIDVGPASFSKDEVEAFLRYFAGDSLIVMSALLVQHENEPYLEYGRDSIFFSQRGKIQDILKHMVLGGKMFRLASYTRPDFVFEYQLLEIKKNSSRSTK